MKIGELLQKEVWSKRTSNKILIGFGFCVVCFVLLRTLDSYWVTPSERRTGKAALAQIDDLQNFSGMSDEEYGARIQQAKGNVDAAEQAAWTSRDRWIGAILAGALAATEVDRLEQKTKFRPSDPKLANRQATSLQNMKAIRNAELETLNRELK